MTNKANKMIEKPLSELLQNLQATQKRWYVNCIVTQQIPRVRLLIEVSRAKED